MKKYNLPVTWEVCGMVEIEANSLEEAIDIFRANSDSIPLPDDGEYVDGSFDLSCPEYETIALYNKEVMKRHCDFCGWNGDEADLDFDEHDIPAYCPKCGHDVNTNTEELEEMDKKYDVDFTSEELKKWADYYKMNNNNWSMQFELCYLDEKTGDIVVQKPKEKTGKLYLDLYNETSLDIVWAGEVACFGNADIYIPIYSAKTNLVYWVFSGQDSNYMDGEVVVLHGHKPDADELREINEEF